MCLKFDFKMPYHCCVTGCRGNYDATKEHPDVEKVCVFSFPRDEARKAEWMRRIPRDNLEVNENTVVCEKHFASQFIVRYDVLPRVDAPAELIRRQRPKLTADAFPSYFPNTPAYLTTEPPTKRRDPDSRREEQQARDEAQFEDWMERDIIRNYNELRNDLERYVANHVPWKLIIGEDCVCFYIVDTDDTPRLRVSIRVRNDLLVEVHRQGCVLGKRTLSWILGTENKLEHWSQLDTLLSHFSSEHSDSDVSISSYIETVDCLLQEVCKRVRESDDYDSSTLERLVLLKEQLALVFAAQRRYSPDTVAFAFHLMCISSTVYEMLREKMLILPSISYLRRLSAVFAADKSCSDEVSAYSVYLKSKADLLQMHERQVILMLDEIHVNRRSSYKGGRIVGMASNAVGSEASTVQAFMMCSLLSSNKDVAAMVPVTNLTATYLVDITKRVIDLLESAGYYVFCIISDNNRVNRNMFSLLCNGVLQPCIKHPLNPERKLFLMFDSVHLLKCIRNNWLGQSDYDHTFLCPGIVNEMLCKASFAHVRDLYSSEKNSVLKLAPNLTHKSIFPNSLERQNVKLALKVFDEKTAAALVEYGTANQIDTSGTHVFICLIIKLFKILNVKSLDKGIRKRDIDSEPIRDCNDASAIFLQDFYYWLVQWESFNLDPRAGCLTNETLFALKHTVQAFTILIPYLLGEMKLSYVLTGKFQTDCLEARFGSYRRLSGTNYHISVQEVQESEKKLKILSLLKIVSKLGSVSIVDFIAHCSSAGSDRPSSVTDEMLVKFGLSTVITECDSNNVSISEAEGKTIIFIAGYVGHQLITNKVAKCDICKSDLITEHKMDVEIDGNDNEQYGYLQSLDRGGLKWPTELLVEVVSQVFIVFNCLVSAKYESIFLSLTSSQKSVLVRLSMDRLNLLSLLAGIDDCVCLTAASDLFESAVSIIANILLNNYCKRCTDRQHAAKGLGGSKRKLATLTK